MLAAGWELDVQFQPLAGPTADRARRGWHTGDRGANVPVVRNAGSDRSDGGRGRPRRAWPPLSVMCGRGPLYQLANRLSSSRIFSRRAGTRMTRVQSVFIVRMNRSITAMLPCWPTAPKRGLMPAPTAPVLEAGAPELRSFVADQVLGRSAGRVDRPCRATHGRFAGGLSWNTAKPIMRRE